MCNKNMNTLAKNGREDQVFKLMGKSREDGTQVSQGPGVTATAEPTFEPTFTL